MRDMRPGGFTLVELMVSMAIFTIVIGTAYAVLNSARMGWYSGDVKIELQEDLRQAADLIVYELSESAPTRVTIGAGGASVTFQVPVDDLAGGVWEDTDSDGVVDFYLAETLDASFNVRWGAYLRREDKTAPSGAREGRSTRFLLAGDELRRRVLSSAGAVVEDFLLMDDIQSVSFTQPAGFNDVVSVTIDASKQTLSRHPVSYSISTAAYLRNSE